MDFLEYLSGEYKPLFYKTRSIMVMNAKGGSGKSTLATNLASFFANEDQKVAIADFDPQGSSMAWLRARPEKSPAIHGLAAWREPRWVPLDVETVILDMPAGADAAKLKNILRRSQTVLVPLIPSAIDLRAAEQFLLDLLKMHEDAELGTKLALVANRAREGSSAYDELEKLAKDLNLPLLATLREHANYLNAAEQGLGIFEMRGTSTDVDAWEDLTRWLKGRRSLPEAAF
jgi:chromosome partitioning protein